MEFWTVWAELLGSVKCACSKSFHMALIPNSGTLKDHLIKSYLCALDHSFGGINFNGHLG